MKKIIYILSAAILAVCASSCEKFLDSSSPSAFDSKTVYSNYDLAEGTIFGITETFCEVNSYRGRFLPWYGFNTDIEWYNTYKPGDGKTDIASYDCGTNNSQLNLSNGPFPLMYMGIERANLVIEGLRQYGDTGNKSDMAYLLAEALTLRAMIYYDLTKAWGDVPARFESLTSNTIYAPKSSRDVIYAQILKDLEEAIPNLPYPGATAATSRTDRVNRVFAEGLYARIALMASGYAIRPDDNAVGTGDLGTVRLSNSAELHVIDVSSVVAGCDKGGSADLHMDFLCAGTAQHFHRTAAGGAPYDGIVNQNNSLPVHDTPDGVELEADPHFAFCLGRGDKGAPDVFVFCKTNGVGDAGGFCVAHGGIQPRIRHTDNNIRLDGMLLRQEGTGLLPGQAYAASVQHGIRPCKIDVFKHTHAPRPGLAVAAV